MIKALVIRLSLIAAVFIILAASALYDVQRYISAQQIKPDLPQYFEVPKGMRFNQLCNAISSSAAACDVLRVVKWWQPRLFNIKAGLYTAPSGSLLDALHYFSTAKPVQFKATMVEGLVATDVIAQLKQLDYLKHNIDEVELLAYTNQQFAQFNLPSAITSLEGTLLPDTYFYVGHDTAQELVKRAIAAMAEELGKAWQHYQQQNGSQLKTAYDVLILASIIEKETGHAPERPLIASVFHNRLRTGMKLQTDPTVIYGLGEAFDGNLTRAHLRGDTPYNTYRIPALPPTPIALASREAIWAAVKPDESDYFYFVASGDGKHVFSKTLAEHNAAVRLYQLKQK